MTVFPRLPDGSIDRSRIAYITLGGDDDDGDYEHVPPPPRPDWDEESWHRDPDDSDPDDSDDDDDDEEEEEEEEDDDGDDEVDPDEDPVVYCTNCGTPFPTGPGSNFCSVCGTGRPASGMQQRAVAPAGKAAGGPNGGSGGPPSAKGGAPSAKSSEQRKLREAKLVKQREVQSFKLAKLAGDAAEQRGWLSAFLAYIRRFDATERGNFLWGWANKAFQHGVTEKDLIDCEGCPHLDGLIASEIMQQHHYLNRPKMSRLYLELMTYTEKCKDSGRQTCGRWMLHLYHRRFDFDTATGSMLSEQHIYKQELSGFSQGEIQNFFDRVNYARGSLPIEQHPDELKLGHWLFLKIKTCKHFEYEIRRYKKAKVDSVRRKFSTLWDRISEWLLEQDHDANAKTVDDALAKGPATPARKAKDPKKKEKGRVGGATNKVEDAAPLSKRAAKRAKAAAAKVSAADGTTPDVNAAPGKAKGKGKPKGAKPKLDTSKMSAAEKANTPCVRHWGSGNCPFGAKCWFSHTVPMPAPPPKGKAAKAKGPPPKKAPGVVALASVVAASGAVGVESAPSGDQARGGALAVPPPVAVGVYATPAADSASVNEWQRKVLLATRGWMPRILATIASVVAPLQACIAGAPNTFRVEWLDDTGAGRHLSSIKHYQKHFGIDADIIKEAAHEPSQALSFYTGGGDNKSAALALTSYSDTWGVCEQHLLADCPDVRSSGLLVEDLQRPRIHWPGELPYYIRDMSKAKVICEESNKIYADRVDENVPVFVDEITISPSTAALPFAAAGVDAEGLDPGAEAEPEGVPAVLPPAAPPEAEDQGGEGSAPPPSGDGQGGEDVIPPPPDPPAEEPEGRAARLKAESVSPLHLMTHYPKNPFFLRVVPAWQDDLGSG